MSKDNNWLGDRKGIRPVKSEWWGAGMVTGARCRLAYGPADATATHCRIKSRLLLPFWYRFTWVVPDKKPFKNGCVNQSKNLL